MSRNRFFNALLPLAVLGTGVAVAALLIATPPEPQRVAPRQSAVLVATVPAQVVEQQFSLTALGVVKPAREVLVQPQVSGVVVEVSEQLVPGGRFAAGDVLFRIDTTDYRIALDTRRTQLAEAQANLALEQGRQEVARREWSLFSDETGGAEDPGLALREPQLKAAQAKVAAAQSQLRQTEVNLERTTIRAPFNAIVRDESVNLGQTLSTQSQAARLVGTDTFRVQASVPVDKLGLIDVPRAGTAGARATVAYDAGTGIVRRPARIARILSDLDPQGQMARVVLQIDDPLALAEAGVAAPLLLGTFVEVEIGVNRSGRVVELPRKLLRDGDRVWLYEEGALAIRPVNVAWRSENMVLIDAGLKDGDRIVTTSLMAPIAGMRLRSADGGDDAASLAAGADGTNP